MIIFSIGHIYLQCKHKNRLGPKGLWGAHMALRSRPKAGSLNAKIIILNRVEVAVLNRGL